MISENIFDKCQPAISSDIDRCGSASLCSINQVVADELDAIYGNGDDQAWSILDTMLRVDYEAKACQIKQNSLYDLIHAMTSPMPKRLEVDPLTRETWMVRPFVNVFRNGIINNKYWAVSGGVASGENWRVDVENIGGNIPSDVRWFPVGLHVYIESKTATGVKTYTAWEVVSATITGDKVRLVLSTLNANSFLDPAELTNPTGGVLTRGLPNVNVYESYCQFIPGLNTRQQTQAWIKSTRLTLCRSEQYEKYHQLLKQNNPRYKEYGNIDTVVKNQQALQDYQNSFVEDWFWAKAYTGQNENDWRDSLEEITIPTNANLVLPFEGDCVGRRANVIGVFEQLAQCDRVFNFGGAPLNLWEFFKMLYLIKRYRQQSGGTIKRIDVLVSTWMKFKIQNAFVAFYNTISGGAIRYPIEIAVKGANNMGFEFDVYKAAGLLGSTEIAIMSHEYFDDRLDANKNFNGDNSEEIWILDWPDIKTWMLDSESVTNVSGTAQEVARVDNDAMCIMRRPKRWVEMIGQSWTVFVECPGKHAILTGVNPNQVRYEPLDDDAETSDTFPYYEAYHTNPAA